MRLSFVLYFSSTNNFLQQFFTFSLPLYQVEKTVEIKSKPDVQQKYSSLRKCAEVLYRVGFSPISPISIKFCGNLRKYRSNFYGIPQNSAENISVQFCVILRKFIGRVSIHTKLTENQSYVTLINTSFNISDNEESNLCTRFV